VSGSMEGGAQARGERRRSPDLLELRRLEATAWTKRTGPDCQSFARLYRLAVDEKLKQE
jgi:hypothetical protein